ncbi:hypothetical protein ACV242_001823 [Peribacillus simplex]
MNQGAGHLGWIISSCVQPFCMMGNPAPLPFLLVIYLDNAPCGLRQGALNIGEAPEWLSNYKPC